MLMWQRTLIGSPKDLRKRYEVYKMHITSSQAKLCFVLQAEEDALDILDDALFLLSREDDDNALNRKVGDLMIALRGLL